MGVAARRNNASLVVSPRGMLSAAALEQRSAQKTFSLALVERDLLRRADVVIASSQGEQSDILALDPSLRVVVVPNGIEQIAARPLPYFGETVLYLGRLDPFKRVELLVEAIALLPSHRLIIAGDGDRAYRAMLEALVVTRGVADRVEFLGWVDDQQKAAAIARTSVLALVSRSENFGVSALEALSVGRPVIVTPGLPWQIHSGMGVLVADDDQPAAIARAIGSSTLRSAYEEASARALITSRGYNWDAIAARFDELLGAPLEKPHIDSTQATTA
jgi:glycosyltransferase involved in cell wall biosynthesis